MKDRDISRGTLVNCKGYMYDTYDEEENAMVGESEYVSGSFGITLDVIPTKDTKKFGWVAKILLSTNNYDAHVGWVWCDFVEKAN